ncbi:MAG: leucyl aminopeptidase [Mycoplasmoidaceae bacterium]
MEINKKNKYEKTLIAIDLKSAINKKNNKVFETFEDKNNIYIVFPKNFKEVDAPNFSWALKDFFSRQKSGINIDLNSFLKLKFVDTKRCSVINPLVTWGSFFTEVPFSMKTTKIEKFSHNIIVPKGFEDCVKNSLVLAEAQTKCRYLQDAPSLIIDPLSFVDEIKKLFKPFEKKVTIKVLTKKEIKAKGMGLLLGVNAGSIIEPRLLVIEYKGSTSKEKFAYVGKGITYDSGGMNIKTGNFMRHMKYDMSGAAIVCTTLYALVKNKIKTNVSIVAPLTENLISPTAIRPDDILTSYNKKTVEIDNTDAEGRLVLADALYYAAKDLKATKLVDIATLTGAMIYSLGDTYSGVWTTEDKDWIAFKDAADKSGEYVWRLPLHNDFRKMLDSDFADIKNSVSNPRAGSSRAACFLVEFTNGLPYIHLDVAATADSGDKGQAVMLKTLYNFARTM